MPKKEALLPRPVSRSEPAEEFGDEEDDDDDLNNRLASLGAPGLLPAPLRNDPPGPSDPVIAPYADFLRFTQNPQVPRVLAGIQEIRGHSWPISAPEEICRGSTNISINSSKDVSLPPAVFSKKHKFTVICRSEPDLIGESSESSAQCSSIRMDNSDGEEEDLEKKLIRFSHLSSKVDFCMQTTNVYKFETRIPSDPAGVFKSSKPRLCGGCSVKAQGSMLPDLRHEYSFMFRHMIHVHVPAGCDFATQVGLSEKSRVDVVTVKICPCGHFSGSGKPEVLRELQVTHFVRVSITPVPRVSSAMPRPLPPEFRDPMLLTVDEDLFDRAEIKYQDKEDADAAQRPAPGPSYPRRPSRSEPE